MAAVTYTDLLDEVRPRPIRSEREHRRALATIEQLMDKSRKSVAEKDMIQLLATLINQYEERVCPTPEFSPGEMLKDLLDQSSLSQTELARHTGIPQSTIANVIAGRRQSNKANVSALAKHFCMSPIIYVG